jgi:hypothetical protein
MKRRKFLQQGTSLAAIPVIAVPSSAYGAPAAAARGAQSLPNDGLLRLSLTRTGTPVEIHGVLERLAAFWAELDNGGTLAATFAADPEAALREAGLSAAIAPDDPIIAVVRASVDPGLRQKATSLDYRAFLAELRRRGLINRLEQGVVTRRLKDVIARDLEAFSRSFDAVLRAHPPLTAIVEKTERLNALLTSPLGPADSLVPPFGRSPDQSAPARNGSSVEVTPHSAVAAATVAVYIAALAYVYVSVAATVTVVLNLGFFVTRHLQIFTPASLSALVRNSGFELEVAKTSTRDAAHMFAASTALRKAHRTQTPSVNSPAPALGMRLAGQFESFAAALRIAGGEEIVMVATAK